MKFRRIAFPLAIVSALAALIYALLRNRKRSGGLPNQSIYRFYAPVYDLVFGRTYAGARRRTAQLLALQPGESLLISGVGTGLDLPLIPAGVTVTGVDISPDMLEQARAKPHRADVRLWCMDAQALDLPEGSFDAALLSLIVSVAPNGRRVFAEAWRVLKPVGRMVIFDKFAPDGGQISSLRRLVGGVIRFLGTDVNRRMSDILGPQQSCVTRCEPSIFAGQYRILVLSKPDMEAGSGVS